MNGNPYARILDGRITGLPHGASRISRSRRQQAVLEGGEEVVLRGRAILRAGRVHRADRRTGATDRARP
jgi:hypothetical protein